MMDMSQCNETCGWFAAFMAALAFGTFAVPLKSKACQKIVTDPLVMQSYQTFIFFVLAWTVPLFGVRVKWTNYGILSGLCWVPGNSLGVYAIRNAGLAVSVGTWCSTIVLVSFTWGIFVFHEKVKSMWGAVAAGVLLVIGLLGMSRFSAPVPVVKDGEKYVLVNRTEEVEESGEMVDTAPVGSASLSSVRKKRSMGQSDTTVSSFQIEESTAGYTRKDNTPDEKKVKTIFGRTKFTKRQLGLICAAINGVWGGSNLIPYHFAKEDGVSSLEYVVSFGTGSMLVLVVMWILRFFYHAIKNCSMKKGYEALPKFNFRDMFLPGTLAGGFYFIGKMFSIIAVTYLGQGVGYSLTQSCLVVSGLWGIFYYDEITERDRIRKWFCSAFIAILGILCLSYEHESG